jgi:nicotinamide riboside kinase
MMNESLVKSREEQQEFDNKMMQVTNLLKELKNNRFNFTIVEGDVDNRLKTCKEVIQKLSLPHL